MQKLGHEGRECYVWWGGYFTSQGDAQVVTGLWPKVPSSFGRVELPATVLAALQSRLRTLDQVLLVELHTHPPGAGGQNETDAENAAATYVGFISIVAPDFAFPALHDLRDCYVYEYVAKHRWRTLDVSEIEERFLVEENFEAVEG